MGKAGIQTRTAHEALNSQSGLGGHDRLTGSTSYYFDGTSGDASFAYVSDEPHASNAPNCWFALKAVSGDITISTTNVNGDGMSTDVIQQGDVYFGPVQIIEDVQSDDVIYAYPA